MADATARTGELWLLRHFEADPASPSVGDPLRPLTARGRREALALGRRLAEAGPGPARAIASPLVRARESATLVCAAFPGLRVEEDGRLAPGGDGEGLAAEVIDAGPLPCLLVGHNPDMELLAFGLTGRGIRFRKGTLARITPGAGERALVEIIETAGERRA